MSTSFTSAAYPLAVRIPTSVRLFRVAASGYRLFRAYQAPAPALIAAAPADSIRGTEAGRRWLMQGLSVVFILGFVLLTWVRAESLTHMMPRLVDLGLGVLAGIIGNSLGYWFGLLGVAPAPACTASQTLKLVQIVGVPVAYVLLGGQMLLMPVTGALLAGALILIGRWLGWANCRTR